MHLLAALRELPISLLITSFALAAAALPVHSTELTPENFKETTTTGLWFIEHFSPYCGHCRRFAPTWEKLVEESEVETPTVKLAQVNCAVHGDLCDENGIKGYPTLLMFEDGKIVDQYKGNREMDDLKVFIKRHIKDTPPPPQVAPPFEPELPRPILNPAGELLVVTGKTFPTIIAQGPTFVKFYAPWCGHCKKLAPIWNQLARHMQNKVTIAEVNCDDHSDLCKAEGVQGYPTLIYFGNGVKSEYNGGRKIDQLKSFAEKASAGGVHPLYKDGDLVTHVAENDVVYLLLQPKADPGVLAHIREASAVLLGSPIIYSSSSPDLLERYSISSTVSWAIITLKDHDLQSPSSVFHGTSALTASNKHILKDWLLSHRLPTTLELTQDTFQGVMNAPEKPLVVIAAVTKDNKEQVKQRFRDVGLKWRIRTGGSGEAHGREIVFTWMDAERWADWMKSMYGVKKNDDKKDLDDVVVFIADHSKLIYYNEDRNGEPIKLTNANSIFSAVEDAAAGKLSYKNSENLVERVARYLNTKMISLEEYVLEKPLHAVFWLFAVVAVIFYALYRFVGSDTSDHGYRAVKGERLD
ncbi:protein disulfide isomerase [Crucibulum laeve]|uniref:Protein disulfide isomerase n=1 Tax=Crucibulum laeve TaxID=68775 RepID=A0A5C3LQ79_9AGAR|nr:protein disulfide isomerase [Crucibulum laeve]